MQWKRITAVAATVMLAAVACGSPSSNNNSEGSTGDAGTAQEKALDPTVKGPAPEVEGAKKGGTITVLSDVTPDTLDPTNIYFTD